VLAPPAAAPPSWIGTWAFRSDRFHEGTLVVRGEDARRVAFMLDLTAGAHIGHLEGDALRNGDRASFTEAGTRCHVSFHRLEQGVAVTTEGCDVGTFGDGVIADGTYGPAPAPPIARPTSNGPPFALEQLRHDTEEYRWWQDARLQSHLAARLGKAYEGLADSMMIVDVTESTPDAITFTGCVRGVCPFVAGYVRIALGGDTWAAYLLDEDGGRHARVVARARRPLPATLTAWLAAHRGYAATE
jgi:hypothetical protein